jgi:PAS domain S-box-containing protein
MNAGRHETATCPDMSASERALAESAERYRSLFSYNPHAAFSLDLEGRYTDANPACLKMTGRTLEEMLQINFSQVIHPEDLSRIQPIFADVVARQPRQAEARVVRVDGLVREVKIIAIPVIVGDQVVGVHGIAEDVTEANRLRRELEDANAAKVLFLANVSHEVRTPLTSVIGASELLLDAELDEEPAHLAELVHRSGERLMHLVNEILDFSRLEAHKVALRPAEFSVREVVSDVKEWAKPRATSRGLSFKCTVDDLVPTRSHGDAGRVAQVLSNLVENAIKFTSSGSVDVRVSVPDPSTLPQHVDPDKGTRPRTVWVRFAVSDTGAGIAADQMATLFDPFFQVDRSDTRAHEGFGLGLAICRDLVDLMGGRLGTVSTPGTGSTFTFCVPLGDLSAELHAAS